MEYGIAMLQQGIMLTQTLVQYSRVPSQRASGAKVRIQPQELTHRFVEDSYRWQTTFDTLERVQGVRGPVENSTYSVAYAAVVEGSREAAERHHDRQHGY